MAYAFQNFLENPTLKLVILFLLCIGDLLIWRFCNLEIWRFPSFLETPAVVTVVTGALVLYSKICINNTVNSVLKL